MRSWPGKEAATPLTTGHCFGRRGSLAPGVSLCGHHLDGPSVLGQPREPCCTGHCETTPWFPQHSFRHAADASGKRNLSGFVFKSAAIVLKGLSFQSGLLSSPSFFLLSAAPLPPPPPSHPPLPLVFTCLSTASGQRGNLTSGLCGQIWSLVCWVRTLPASPPPTPFGDETRSSGHFLTQLQPAPFSTPPHPPA